ncbi:Uncharacterized protein FWK35_00033720, partial [Aphis craccivora]
YSYGQRPTHRPRVQPIAVTNRFRRRLVSCHHLWKPAPNNDDGLRYLRGPGRRPKRRKTRVPHDIFPLFSALTSPARFPGNPARTRREGYGVSPPVGRESMRQIKIIFLLFSYTNDDELGKWLKLFFGLPFLPPHEIENAFVELVSICPNIDIGCLFSDYILNTNVEDDCLFPPKIWAQEPSENHRTTYLKILNAAYKNLPSILNAVKTMDFVCDGHWLVMAVLVTHPIKNGPSKSERESTMIFAESVQQLNR